MKNKRAVSSLLASASCALGITILNGIEVNATLPEYRPFKQEDPSLSHNYPNPRWVWGEGFFKRIEQNVVLSGDLPSEVIEASGLVADDGKLYNPKLNAESQDLQANADCFQAFVSASFYTKREDQNSGKLRTINFPFEKSLRPKYSSEAVKQFFASNPELQETSVAVRKIPVEVLTRYPGVLPEQDILGTKNIIAIRKDNYLGIIAAQGAKWQDFYQNHPTATVEQILKFADQ